MKLRLYLDEDAVSRALVRGLRARGVDGVTNSQSGLVERSDADNLEYATSEGRTLVSYNVAEYCRLHNDWLSRARSHAGLIVTQQQRYSMGE